MQDAKKGILNVIYGFLGQVVIICLGIVIPRLVLVRYGSEVNGLLNSVTQIFTCFSLLEAGVGIASLQALYAPVANGDREKIQGIMAATHRFYRKTGILYALAVAILAFAYPFIVDSDIPYWTIVGIIMFGGLANCINFFYQGKYKILMQAEGYNYISINITTLVNVLTSLAKVVLLLLGYNVLAVQFSFFVINLLQMAVYGIYIHKRYAWIDLKAEPDEKAISQKNATLVHQVSSLIFSNTDALLLTLITRDLKIVSIYTMYNMVIAMATNMIQQVEGGFGFMLGQRYNTDRENYFVLHHIFEILYLVLVFAVMTTIYVFLLPFMRLYTAEINDASYIHTIYPLLFVLTPLLTYGRTAANNIINYAGHFRQTQWRAILESAINIAVSVVGIWKLGIPGALLGTIAASLYRTNDIILYAYKYLIHDKPWRTYMRWLASFAVFGIVVFCIPVDMPYFDSYLKLIAGGCVFGVGSVLVYTLVQTAINPREMKTAFALIRDYIKKG